MFDLSSLPIPFLSKAARVLAELSGSKIVDAFLDYGDRFDVAIPYPETQFGGRNKRYVLLESLKAFSGTQQFLIIDELCEHGAFAISSASRDERKRLRYELHSRYDAFKTEPETKELDLPLIEETRHWLQSHPDALKLFNAAKTKYDMGALDRNVLDDLRLALELLLKDVLTNQKSLENQLPLLGPHLKGVGLSSLLVNMLRTLLDYYTKYQNAFVKHEDAVKAAEVELIFELTASFMKHIARVSV